MSAALSVLSVRSRLGMVAALTGAVVVGTFALYAPDSQAGTVPAPPAHAGFDYQIGGAYDPPAGVSVVTRDHEDSPASGRYNICYLNAFQAQQGHQGDWDSDLLLRDGNGDVVMDENWGEALLDIGTAAKRKRIASKVDKWIDGCATHGFDAVEPDNLDSYQRSHKLLNSTDAKAFAATLTAHAHARKLSIGQKNAADLAGSRSTTGFDFAVAEECGQYDECGDYTSAYGKEVIDIEYTAAGLTKACSDYGSKLSIVRRDVDVSTPGDSGYLRKTC